MRLAHPNPCAPPPSLRSGGRVMPAVPSLQDRQPHLLKCTLLGQGGSRQRAVVWVSQAERRSIVLVVVLAFFQHSCQLASLQHPATAPLTVDNCWLGHTECVKPSTASKRVRELDTGCVHPAAKSRINHTAWAEEVSGWRHLGRHRQPERRVRWNRAGGDYIQLSFDMECKVFQAAAGAAWHKPENPPWKVQRVELMLHQLVWYLTNPNTCECQPASQLAVQVQLAAVQLYTWQQYSWQQSTWQQYRSTRGSSTAVHLAAVLLYCCQLAAAGAGAAAAHILTPFPSPTPPALQSPTRIPSRSRP